MTILSKARTLISVCQIKRFFIFGRNGLIKDQKGATAIEYGLLVSLIGLVIILTLTQIGNSTTTIFQSAKEAIDNAPPSS